MATPCYYEIRGGCQKGDTCPFLHRSSIPCYWQSHGGCTKGATCPFLHGTTPATDDDNASNEYGAPITDIPNGTPATTSATAEASPPTLEQPQEQKQVPATTDGPKPRSTSPLSTATTATISTATASVGIESKPSIFQRLHGPALNEQHLQDRKSIPDLSVTAVVNNQQQQRGFKIIPDSSAVVATTAAPDQQQKDSKPIPDPLASAAAPRIASLMNKRPNPAFVAAFVAANLTTSSPASRPSRSVSPPKQPRSQTIATELPKQTTTITVPNSSAPVKQQPVALDKVKILTLEEIRAAKRAKQEAEEAAKKEKEGMAVGATQKNQAQTQATQAQPQAQASKAQPQAQASQVQIQAQASQTQTQAQASQAQASQAQTQAQATTRKINRSRQPPPAIAAVTPAAISTPTTTAPQFSAAILKQRIPSTPGAEASGNAPITASPRSQPEVVTSDTNKRPAKQEVLVAAAAAKKYQPDAKAVDSASSNGKGSATNGINSGTIVPATASTGKVPVVALTAKRNLETSAGGPTQNGANKKTKVDPSAIAITNTKSNVAASTPSIRPPVTTKAITPSTPAPKPTTGVPALDLGTLSTIESALEDDEMLLDAPEFYDKELSAKDIEEMEKELGLVLD